MDSTVVADPKVFGPVVRDYRLQPNSPALKIGFQPIDLDPIGPFAGPDRASWPIAAPSLVREQPRTYPGRK